MTLIQKSAFLDICSDCKAHAHIVFASGKRSREFVTKEAGLKILEAAKNYGKLSVEEYQIVAEQISTCTLPSKSSLLDGVVEDLYQSNEDDLIFRSRPSVSTIRNN